MAACYVQPWVGLSHGIQIVAARGLLGFSQEDLAAAAGIKSVKTIGDFEKYFRGRISTLVQIQTALEKRGIRFIDEGGEVGAVLRKPEPRRKR